MGACHSSHWCTNSETVPSDECALTPPLTAEYLKRTTTTTTTTTAVAADHAEAVAATPLKHSGSGYCYTLTNADGETRPTATDGASVVASERALVASRRCTQMGSVFTTPEVLAQLEAGVSRRNALRPSQSDPGPHSLEGVSIFGSR